MPPGTDVTDNTVNVAYDGTGTLKGTKGAPVQSFNEEAEDPFAAALTITEPDVEPVTTTKPDIKGTAEADSTVERFTG